MKPMFAGQILDACEGIGGSNPPSPISWFGAMIVTLFTVFFETQFHSR